MVVLFIAIVLFDEKLISKFILFYLITFVKYALQTLNKNNKWFL